MRSLTEQQDQWESWTPERVRNSERSPETVQAPILRIQGYGAIRSCLCLYEHLEHAHSVSHVLLKLLLHSNEGPSLTLAFRETLTHNLRVRFQLHQQTETWLSSYRVSLLQPGRDLRGFLPDFCLSRAQVQESLIVYTPHSQTKSKTKYETEFDCNSRTYFKSISEFNSETTFVSNSETNFETYSALILRLDLNQTLRLTLSPTPRPTLDFTLRLTLGLTLSQSLSLTSRLWVSLRDLLCNKLWVQYQDQI